MSSTAYPSCTPVPHARAAAIAKRHVVAIEDSPGHFQGGPRFGSIPSLRSSYDRYFIEFLFICMHPSRVASCSPSYLVSTHGRLQAPSSVHG